MSTAHSRENIRQFKLSGADQLFKGQQFVPSVDKWLPAAAEVHENHLFKVLRAAQGAGELVFGGKHRSTSLERRHRRIAGQSRHVDLVPVCFDVHLIFIYFNCEHVCFIKSSFNLWLNEQ